MTEQIIQGAGLKRINEAMVCVPSLDRTVWVFANIHFEVTRNDVLAGT